jgi:hypothetical protein
MTNDSMTDLQGPPRRRGCPLPARQVPTDRQARRPAPGRSPGCGPGATRSSSPRAAARAGTSRSGGRAPTRRPRAPRSPCRQRPRLRISRPRRRRNRQTQIGPAGGCRAGRSDSGTRVEVAGIEPASFSTSPGLLRAQPAVLFSAPAVTQASCRRAQPLLVVPSSPAAGLNGRSSSLMPDTGPEELPG